MARRKTTMATRYHGMTIEVLTRDRNPDTEVSRAQYIFPISEGESPWTGRGCCLLGHLERQMTVSKRDCDNPVMDRLQFDTRAFTGRLSKPWAFKTKQYTSAMNRAMNTV